MRAGFVLLAVAALFAVPGVAAADNGLGHAYGISVGSVLLIVVDAIGLICGALTLLVALSLRGSLVRPNTWSSCPAPTLGGSCPAPAASGPVLRQA